MAEPLFSLRDVTRHSLIRKERVQCFTRNLQFNWVSSSWIEPFNAILNQDHNLNPFLISLSTQSLRRNESFHLGNLHNNWASLFGSSLFESSLHFLSLNKQTSDLSFTFPHASCCLSRRQCSHSPFSLRTCGINLNIHPNIVLLAFLTFFLLRVHRFRFHVRRN
jgi:hypothetical protein